MSIGLLLVSVSERGKAIAVSVRNFRIGGVRNSFDGESILTIQTALQIAVEYQLRGLEVAAKSLYEGILNQIPDHADALHLLGVVLYQQGDAKAAIPLIEKAIAAPGEETDADYLNTLGECYRVLGKFSEAEHFFEMVLSKEPNRVSTLFNLGLTYQQAYQWDKAIEVYRNVVEANEFSDLEKSRDVHQNIR